MAEVPFEAIISSMAEAVIAVDQSCQVQFVNPAARQLLRISMPVTSGRPLLEVIRHTEFHDALLRALQSSQPTTAELTFFHPDERIFRVQAVRYADTSDSASAIAVLSDITELRKLERLRRDFVANVSHELRTPITAIEASVETLQSGAGAIKKERERFLGKIDTQVHRLARLVDELIALAQIESGATSIEMMDVRLEPLVGEVFAALESQAQDSEVVLDMQIPANLSTVRANADHLYQVIVNLCDNAIKFNRPHGSVTVTAHASTTEDMIDLMVTDTGTGIPTEDVPRIFERFYRVEKGRARSRGGAGLGLAIVRHLVESMGGQLAVQSTVDQGSTFTVSLPCSRA